MQIEILGAHNCEIGEQKFASLLIDGRLAIDAGGLTRSLSLEAQQRLTAVLLTHHHYDHIRDIPAIAMNMFLNDSRVSIFSTEPVRQALATHFLNGELYPRFLEEPEEKPTIEFTVVAPDSVTSVGDYTVTAVPMPHTIAAVGYQIIDTGGKSIFYTGDTGAGLGECWAKISPQLLIIEVTAPDKFQEWALRAHHLTPGLLKQELLVFRQQKGYLPRVVTVHTNPSLEGEIRQQLETLAADLKDDIEMAYEGMRLEL